MNFEGCTSEELRMVLRMWERELLHIISDKDPNESNKNVKMKNAILLASVSVSDELTRRKLNDT